MAFLALTRRGWPEPHGTELFDALGIIRTEELLQARRLDGGQQFFGQGVRLWLFEDARRSTSKWNEREALADVVRVIRMFRPLVIYARHTGTPTDGHGHHRIFGLRRSPSKPPQINPVPRTLKEGLRPWQAKKLYQGTGGGGCRSRRVRLRFRCRQACSIRCLAGRIVSTIEVMMFSADTNMFARPRGSALHLNASLVAGRESSLFDGIDTRVTGIAGVAGLPDGALRSELQAIDAATRKAIDGYLARSRAGRACSRRQPAPCATRAAAGVGSAS